MFLMARIFILSLLFIFSSLPAYSMLRCLKPIRHTTIMARYGSTSTIRSRCSCIKAKKIFCFEQSEENKQKTFFRTLRLYEKKLEEHRVILENYQDHPDLEILSVSGRCQHTAACAKVVEEERYDKVAIDFLKSEAILCACSGAIIAADLGINALTFLACAIHPINFIRIGENMGTAECDSLDEKAMTVQLNNEIDAINFAIERFKKIQEEKRLETLKE